MSTTTTRLNNSQSSLRHKHAAKVYRAANSVARTINEYNEMLEKLRPNRNRIINALENLGDASCEANAFLKSIGSDLAFCLAINVDIPSKVEYDLSNIDDVHDAMVDLPRE